MTLCGGALNISLQLPKPLFIVVKSTMSDPCTNSSQEAIARLREFGYAFNEGDYTNNYSLCHILSYPYVRAAGELRKIDAASGKPGDLPYEFKISDNPAINQEHYEQLANQIPDIIYELLERMD